MGSTVQPTEYKEPSERTSVLGFASSILNGNTVEGGLRSLTYKSIFALKLVDELDLVRDCIVSDKPQLTRITDTDTSKNRLEALRSEVSELKTIKPARDSADDQKVLQFNLRLDEELNQNRLVSDSYSNDVKEYYLLVFQNLDITFSNKSYVKHTVKYQGKVERMEDVEGFDRSIYERARERRMEEEHAKQLEEEERKRQELEEKLKEQERLRAEELQKKELARLEYDRTDNYVLSEEYPQNSEYLQNVGYTQNAEYSQNPQQQHTEYNAAHQYPPNSHPINGMSPVPMQQLYNNDGLNDSDAMHLDGDSLMTGGADSYSMSPNPDQFTPMAQDSPYLQAQSPF